MSTATVSHIAAGEGATLNVIHSKLRVLVPSAASQGSLFVAELEALGGRDGAVIPLHVHPGEDETYYILSGEFRVYREDGTSLVARQGETVYVPRGIPHSIQNISDGPSRMLLIVSPVVGTEAFFRSMHAASTQGTPALETTTALADQAGLVIVGPPSGGEL